MVLYLEACRSSAGGTGHTRGHGGAGWQQETGPRLDSETAAGGPGHWCSLLCVFSLPLAMHPAVKARGGAQAGDMQGHHRRG